MIKVLMIDDNVSLVNMVKEYFRSSSDVEVLFSAHDGDEGLKLIVDRINEYDIILLDLIMPKKDGVYVLEEMKRRHIRKDLIVVTSYNAAETVREISGYDVSYYILKPFDLSDLKKRIIDIHERKKVKEEDIYTHNIKATITKILHDLGIPSHIKGYQYIREGVGIVFDKPETIGGITKELYPELAHKFNTTVSRVERAIRHAIEISWNRGDLKYMEELFGNSVDIDRSKPTNSEFIVTVADRLRLDFHRVGV